jgi:hypothetical protein
MTKPNPVREAIERRIQHYLKTSPLFQPPTPELKKVIDEALSPPKK